ncbi:MAG: transposase [Pseudomonadota bacterium]
MPSSTPEQFIFASLYTRNRETLLSSAEAKRLLLSKMHETKHQFRLNIAAYVLLDDHMHWLFFTPAGNEPSAIVNHLRAATQRDWRKLQPEWGESAIWEHGNRCTLPVDKPDLKHYLDFIHYDPVRHGLAEKAMDYKWSSLPARVAEGYYPEDWGTLGAPIGITKVLKYTAEAALAD